MRESVALFFSLQTQWRYTSAGLGGTVRTGLDYGAVEATARLSGVTVTPLLFDDIRTLERAALAVWSGKNGGL